MRFQIVVAVLAVGLAGCSQTGRGVGAVIGPTSAAGIVEVKPDVTEIAVSDTVPTGATVIGQLKGVSCKNSAFDPPPMELTAREQLRQKVLSAGGTGVAAITYTKGGTSLVMNCWSTITATGTAYKQ